MLPLTCRHQGRGDGETTGGTFSGWAAAPGEGGEAGTGPRHPLLTKALLGPEDGPWGVEWGASREGRPPAGPNPGLVPENAPQGGRARQGEGPRVGVGAGGQRPLVQAPTCLEAGLPR